MTATWWAVLLAGLAGALLAGGSPAAARVAAAGRSPGGRPPGGPAASRRPRLCAARVLRWRQRRRAAVLRASLSELLDGVVAELRAGADPRAAVAAAAGGLPELGPLAAAARSPTGRPVAALLALGRRPGGAAARSFAVAWSVAEATGSGLAGPAQRVRQAVRDDERLRREVAAGLAGARSTARLLALLPLVGLLLGTGLGADPLGWLTGTAAGLACALLGGGLVAAGLWWTGRIAASVTREFSGDP